MKFINTKKFENGGETDFFTKIVQFRCDITKTNKKIIYETT